MLMPVSSVVFDEQHETFRHFVRIDRLHSLFLYAIRVALFTFVFLYGLFIIIYCELIAQNSSQPSCLKALPNVLYGLYDIIVHHLLLIALNTGL